MLPWIELDRATIPGDGDELRLKQRGQEFSIMLGSNELMNSRLSGSEEALATLAHERIAGGKNLSMLIGGLGMGFTLRAALAVLPGDARVTVAELVPAVVDWARGPMADLHKGTLDDPRVDIHVGDVGALIRSKKAAYDAILLDVDNGPDALTSPTNARLYGLNGLARIRTALARKAILAVWSAADDPRFTARMARAGYEVRVERVLARHNARKAGGKRHVIWIARRRD
jgi:spermidine synthase